MLWNRSGHEDILGVNSEGAWQGIGTASALRISYSKPASHIIPKAFALLKESYRLVGLANIIVCELGRSYADLGVKENGPMNSNKYPAT